MIMAVALLVLAASASIPPPTATTVAVRCVGTDTRQDEKVEPTARTEIYILRDDLNRIDRWSVEAGAEINLCDTAEDKCEANFFPNQVGYIVHNDPASTIYHSQMISLDRRTGELFEYDSMYGYRTKFVALCQRIPMPVADTSANKF